LRISRRKPFIVFQGAPALVAELRSIVGLEALQARRDQFALVRCGHLLVAVPIDACIGIRTIDLERQMPVPSRIVRDGGMPIGHILEIDGRMAMVLDPARLVDAHARSLWATAVRRADALKRRQAKMESLWSEIRTVPSATAIRTYASLCSRAGRAGTAAAARAVLSCWSNGESSQGEAPANTENRAPLVRLLLQLAEERRTGQLVVDGNGAGDGNVELLEGRVVNVQHANRHGRAALTQLLGVTWHGSHFHDQPLSGSDVGTITSSVATLIEALESVAPRTP